MATVLGKVGGKTYVVDKSKFSSEKIRRIQREYERAKALAQQEADRRRVEEQIKRLARKRELAAAEERKQARFEQRKAERGIPTDRPSVTRRPGPTTPTGAVSSTFVKAVEVSRKSLEVRRAYRAHRRAEVARKRLEKTVTQAIEEISAEKYPGYEGRAGREIVKDVRESFTGKVNGKLVATSLGPSAFRLLPPDSDRGIIRELHARQKVPFGGAMEGELTPEAAQELGFQRLTRRIAERQRAAGYKLPKVVKPKVVKTKTEYRVRDLSTGEIKTFKTKFAADAFATRQAENIRIRRLQEDRATEILEAGVSRYDLPPDGKNGLPSVFKSTTTTQPKLMKASVFDPFALVKIKRKTEELIGPTLGAAGGAVIETFVRPEYKETATARRYKITKEKFEKLTPQEKFFLDPRSEFLFKEGGIREVGAFAQATGIPAAAGAAIGTTAGPVGTLVGGLAGGVLGVGVYLAGRESERKVIKELDPKQAKRIVLSSPAGYFLQTQSEEQALRTVGAGTRLGVELPLIIGAQKLAGGAGIVAGGTAQFIKAKEAALVSGSGPFTIQAAKGPGGSAVSIRAGPLLAGAGKLPGQPTVTGVKFGKDFLFTSGVTKTARGAGALQPLAIPEGTGVIPTTEFQTQLALAASKLPGSTLPATEATRFEKAYGIISELRTQPSIFERGVDVSRVRKVSTPAQQKAVESFLKKRREDIIVKGTVGAETQLDPAVIGRRPIDIDIFGVDVSRKQLRAELVTELKKQKAKYKIGADGDVLLRQLSGRYEKAFDIKTSKDIEPDIEGSSITSDVLRLGFPVSQKPLQIEGQFVPPLGEQLLRKGSVATTLQRELVGPTKPGRVYKDIYSFQEELAPTLIKSAKAKPQTYLKGKRGEKLLLEFKATRGPDITVPLGTEKKSPLDAFQFRGKVFKPERDLKKIIEGTPTDRSILSGKGGELQFHHIDKKADRGVLLTYDEHKRIEAMMAGVMKKDKGFYDLLRVGKITPARKKQLVSLSKRKQAVEKIESQVSEIVTQPEVSESFYVGKSAYKKLRGRRRPSQFYPSPVSQKDFNRFIGGPSAPSAQTKPKKKPKQPTVPSIGYGVGSVTGARPEYTISEYSAGLSRGFPSYRSGYGSGGGTAAFPFGYVPTSSRYGGLGGILTPRFPSDDGEPKKVKYRRFYTRSYVPTGQEVLDFVVGGPVRRKRLARSKSLQRRTKALKTVRKRRR